MSKLTVFFLVLAVANLIAAAVNFAIGADWHFHALLAITCAIVAKDD